MSLFGSGRPSTQGEGDGWSPDVRCAGQAADRALGAVGELSVAEAARRNKRSETSVAKWRDQFLQAGMGALQTSAARGPSTREAQLERELAELTSALGEAHVELRLLRREGAGFGSRIWR